MKNFVILIFCFFLIACVNLKAAQERLENALNGWIGQPVDNAVDVLGYPTGDLIAPNGNKVYVFARSSSVRMPVTTTSNYTSAGNNIQGTSVSTGGTNLGLWCRVYLEVDHDNTVIKWKHEGNNCGMN